MSETRQEYARVLRSIEEVWAAGYVLIAPARCSTDLPTMHADKRRLSSTTRSPAVPFEARQAIVLQQFRQDLTHWIAAHPRTALRVMRLVDEVLRDPFIGTGKPEALKYSQHGQWSRRITDGDRLVYLPHGTAIYFIAARHHY